MNEVMTPLYFHLNYPALGARLYIHTPTLTSPPFLTRLSELINPCYLSITNFHHRHQNSYSFVTTTSATPLFLHIVSLLSSALLLLQYGIYTVFLFGKLPAFHIATAKMSPQSKPDHVVRSELTPVSCQPMGSLVPSVLDLSAFASNDPNCTNHGREVDRSLDYGMV